jgi:hypothetical protein
VLGGERREKREGRREERGGREEGGERREERGGRREEGEGRREGPLTKSFTLLNSSCRLLRIASSKIIHPRKK